MLKLIAGLLIAGSIGLGAAPIAIAQPAQGQGANAGQDAGTPRSNGGAPTASAGGQGGAPTANAGGAGGGSLNDQLVQRNYRSPFGAFENLIRVIFGHGR